METKDILTDVFSRIKQLVHQSAEGLDRSGLMYRPEADANSIAWLVWHLTRIQDDHVFDITGSDQTWVSEGWAQEFGMKPDSSNDGRGHNSEQVAQIAPDGPAPLLAYHDAVHGRTTRYLSAVDAAELDRIIGVHKKTELALDQDFVRRKAVGEGTSHCGCFT